MLINPNPLAATTAAFALLLGSAAPSSADPYDSNTSAPRGVRDANNEPNFDLPNKAGDYAEARARVRQLRVDRAAAAEELATVRQRLVRDLTDNDKYENGREAVQQLEEQVSKARDEAMEKLQADDAYGELQRQIEELDRRLTQTAPVVARDDVAAAASPSVEEVVTGEIEEEEAARPAAAPSAADLQRQQLAAEQLELNERASAMRERVLEDGDYERLSQELDQKKEELRDVIAAMRQELRNNPQYAAAKNRVNDIYNELQDARIARAAAGAEYDVAANLEEEEDVQERTFGNDYGYWDDDVDIELN